mmetsp:Transcript_63926/g.101363  ORF Transcript_63926/g.101363 Transcript_63926/m.101363 type:complete len:317 (-) Transcript_63926:175-1125(-)
MGCTVGAQSSAFGARFSIDEVLHEGAFGKIFSCVDRKTKTAVAMKSVKAVSVKEKVRAMREHSIWECLGKSSNIVSLIERFSERGCIYFVMERCDISLDKVLERHPDHCYAYCLQFIYQLLLGVKHCYGCSVVHRNIQLSNVLLGYDGAVKLCDLGDAAVLPQEGFVGIMGAAAYMSPEMVKLQYYGHKTDIWSCGVIAYRMLYGEYPYWPSDAMVDDKRIMLAIRDNTPRPRYAATAGLPQAPNDSASVAQALLIRKCSDRPDAIKCLEHEAFACIRSLDTKLAYPCFGHGQNAKIDSDDNASNSTTCTSTPLHL